MKTTLLIAAIAVGSTLAVAAQAREGHGARMQMPAFEDLDMNADGTLTPEEIGAAMQAHAAARFAQTDTNGDGALSAEEMLANADAQRAERMANRIAERIERADTNGDGLLQQSELTARMEDRRDGHQGADRLFNRFDANEDGALSAEEFAQAQEQMQGRRDHRRSDN